MIIGIDPGLQGAIVSISNEGKLIEMKDMPTITIKKGKSTKNIYDILIFF